METFTEKIMVLNRQGYYIRKLWRLLQMMAQYVSPIFDTSVISVNFWHIQNASWQALAYMQCIMGKLNVYTSSKKEVKKLNVPK